MMIRVAAGVLGLATALACAVPAARAQEAMRPAVGKPLAQAGAMLRAHNYAKANAAVHAAMAAPGLTGHEQAVIAQMRAAIASASGDNATAAAVYKQLLDSNAVSGAEALRLMQSEASIAYSSKNYANVAYWADRYLKAGGTDASMHTLLLQAYYLQGNYAQAAHMEQATIQADVRAGRPPREEQLQLLYSCQQHLGDKSASLTTIKQLVYYYPKPDYWLNVIDNLRTNPNFSDRLLMDIYRLEFSLGLVNKPDEAMDFSELLVQAGLPGEAKDVVDKSYAGGLLGTGPDAARHQRLRDLINRTYAATKAQLGKQDADAATDHDGNRLLGLGETYVSYGNFTQGLPMMEQAIGKDQLRHPEDAKLQLGLAYWKAGQKAKAIAALRKVGGHEGVGDLAQLWVIRISQSK